MAQHRGIRYTFMFISEHINVLVTILNMINQQCCFTEVLLRCKIAATLIRYLVLSSIEIGFKFWEEKMLMRLKVSQDGDKEASFH